MPVNQFPAANLPVKLGKSAPKLDSRTLQMGKYLKRALPPPPQSQDWSSKVPAWLMMVNDTVGDCTCACAGHMIQQWTTYAQPTTFIPTDPQIIAAYAAITGYDPITHAHDNGAAVLDVLNYWRKTGIAGHQIEAFAALDWTNPLDIKDAVFLFGNCYLGIQLPQSAAHQAIWSVPPGGPVGPAAPGSWGGHAIPVVDYDPRGLTVITWGAPKRLTWGFLETYCDEAYAVLSPDWLNSATQTTPVGLDLATLRADLLQITTASARVAA